jgi:ATP-dependent DNA helicase RecQ
MLPESAIMPAWTASELHKQLLRFFSFPGFRPGQQEVIEKVMRGESLLAVMPTGSGKSLCYQLPAILLPGSTLVISPLIALMQNQITSLPPILAEKATYINSTISSREADSRLQAMESGTLKLLYVSPERLRHLSFLYFLAQCKLSLIVVDEAHCVDIWGHDFRPDYASLYQAIHMLGNPPVLALTATASRKTHEAIQTALRRPLELMHYGVCRKNLRLEVEPFSNQEEKTEAVIRRCLEETGRGIVYTSSRQKAEQLMRGLQSHGVESAFYHAGMNSEERTEVQRRFEEGVTRVLTATTAFGLGIDVSDIRFILHYDPPASLDEYTQEAGRAGRDGLLSRCTLFYCPSDLARLRRQAESRTPDFHACVNVLQAIRHYTCGRVQIVATDDLRRDTQMEATDIRVAISYLERAGCLRRHFDSPLSISLQRGSRQDTPFSPPQLRSVLFSLCPSDGSWNSLSTQEVSEELGIPVDAVEPFLLACQSEGWIRYRGSLREFTLEPLTLDSNTESRLHALIQEYYQASRIRLEKMLTYLQCTQCRHSFLSDYFECDGAAACAVCDNCRPNGTSRRSPSPSSLSVTQSEQEIRRRILRCIAGLPVPLGRSGLVHLLQGSSDCPASALRSSCYGYLKEMRREEIVRFIEGLLSDGLLAAEKEKGFLRLKLTLSGVRFARGSVTQD